MSSRTIGRTAQGARRPRIAAGAVLSLMVLTVAGYAGAPSASAYPVHNQITTATDTGTASVIGTVSVKTAPPGSPAGVEITLTEIPTSGDSITRTTTADARGGYVFRDLAGGADWSYAVSATYAGTVFESDTVQVEGGKIVDVPMPLYPSTTSNTKLSETAWAVWVDMTGNTMAVQQDVALKNSGTEAYTGTTKVPGTPAGLDKAAFTLPVAAGATKLEYLGHFQACCGAIEGTTWSHTRPISPGVMTGTLRYEAAFASTMTFPVTLPTADFSIIVPQSLTLTSTQLTKNGTNSDQGVVYDVYKAKGALSAGTIITVTLSQGPVASSGIAWWLIALVAVVLIAVVLGLWLLVRRRHAAQADATAKAPAAKGGAKAAPAKTKAAKGKPAKPAPAKPSPPKATPPVPATAGAAGAAAAAAATVEPPASTPVEPAPAPAEPVVDEPAVEAPAVNDHGVEPAAVPTTAAPAPGTRADQLTDELATLDLAWENGTITDEGAYRRIRESLVARLVAELGAGN